MGSVVGMSWMTVTIYLQMMRMTMPMAVSLLTLLSRPCRRHQVVKQRHNHNEIHNPVQLWYPRGSPNRHYILTWIPRSYRLLLTSHKVRQYLATMLQLGFEWIARSLCISLLRVSFVVCAVLGILIATMKVISEFCTRFRLVAPIWVLVCLTFGDCLQRRQC